MRTAGLPDFRKLYGKVEQDLLPGTYYIRINNTYNAVDFKGKKFFVLATTNELGGKNFCLAYCYIGGGILCLMFSVVLLIATYLEKK
jgi:hypothetical protein